MEADSLVSIVLYPCPPGDPFTSEFDLLDHSDLLIDSQLFYDDSDLLIDPQLFYQEP